METSNKFMSIPYILIILGMFFLIFIYKIVPDADSNIMGFKPYWADKRIENSCKIMMESYGVKCFDSHTTPIRNYAVHFAGYALIIVGLTWRYRGYNKQKYLKMASQQDEVTNEHPVTQNFFIRNKPKQGCQGSGLSFAKWSILISMVLLFASFVVLPPFLRQARIDYCEKENNYMTSLSLHVSKCVPSNGPHVLTLVVGMLVLTAGSIVYVYGYIPKRFPTMQPLCRSILSAVFSSIIITVIGIVTTYITYLLE